jgi:hydroxypyruvate isomerase
VPGREAEFAAALDIALGYARTLECPRVHVMSGLVTHGAETVALVANLRTAAARAAAADVVLLLEPIKTYDMPGYRVSRTSQVMDVTAAVGAPNVRLLFDLYFRQFKEGDLSRAIRDDGQHAAHVQIAQVPDRGEREHGEVDFRHVLAALADSSYAGWIGCEYRPRGATGAGLGWLARSAGQARFASAGMPT